MREIHHKQEITFSPFSKIDSCRKTHTIPFLCLVLGRKWKKYVIQAVQAFPTLRVPVEQDAESRMSGNPSGLRILRRYALARAVKLQSTNSPRNKLQLHSATALLRKCLHKKNVSFNSF